MRQRNSYLFSSLVCHVVVTAIALSAGMVKAAPTDPVAPIVDTVTPASLTPTIPPGSPFSIAAPEHVITLDLASQIATQVDVFDKVEAADAGTTTTLNPTGNVGPLAPGRHTITWTATDLGGNSLSSAQDVDVLPRVDFAVDQTAVEGNTNVTVTAYLTGKAPIYPVTIPYIVAVASTATGGGVDHNAASGNIVINSPDTSGNISFTIIDDGAGDAGETIIFTIDTLSLQADRVDAGTIDTHTVTITETNLAPIATISASQDAGITNTRTITTSGGVVELTANAHDPNGDATITSYDWSATDNSLVPLSGTTGTTFTFDPSGLSSSFYRARLTVSDGTNSTPTDLFLRIVETAPTLSDTTDLDDDGVIDATEGFLDDDNDGIPNHYDAVTNPSLLQGMNLFTFDSSVVSSDSLQSGTITLDWELTTTASNRVFYPMLINAQPGIKLGIGQVAFLATQHYARLPTSIAETIISKNINSNPDTPPVLASSDGQVVDLEISGLTSTGQSVKIVIPQAAPLPAGTGGSNPEFWVYDSSKNWAAFSATGSNAIATTTKTGGYCPAPEDAAYLGTLAAGDECLQITVTDGGPNDYDGQANGVIRLLGAPFITTSVTADSGSSSTFSGSTDSSTESLNKHVTTKGGGGYLGIVLLIGLVAGNLYKRKIK